MDGAKAAEFSQLESNQLVETQGFNLKNILRGLHPTPPRETLDQGRKARKRS